MDEIPRKKAMTVSERVKKFRDKKKSDENYKMSESKRIEMLRKKKVSGMTVFEKKKYKEAARERQRKCRERKRLALEKQTQNLNSAPESSQASMPQADRPSENSNQISLTSNKSPRSFKTPQSLGKAVRRSLKSLPNSPTKKIEVITGVAKRIGLNLLNKCNDNLSPTAEPSQTDKSVVEFYYRSDIVYTMPGLKDEMVVWEKGEKKKMRKYYLTVFLREAYAIYKETVTEDKLVGFSKFCSLRPKNVLLLKNTPMDQCKCKHHENFRLMLKALKVNYDGGWWDNVLCNSNSLQSQCWLGNCNVCKDGQLCKFDIDPGSTVFWKKWEKNESGRLVIHTKEGCAGELVELLKETFSMFLEHVRTKRIQAAAFDSDINEQKCILQIDFAMAYSCEYQNEIQSALWSRQSVQLFTAARFENGKCTKTYLICSDTKDKNKDTVFVFLNKLIGIVLHTEKQDVVIYSDGPSSEFKNKYIVCLMMFLRKKFNVNITWKYFATSHGKGVVDGIGGRAKSLVRQLSQAQNDKYVVQSSYEFYKAASSVMKSTEVLHISQDEINETLRLENPWDSVVDIGVGIQKTHVIKCNLDGNILLYKDNLSTSPLIKIQTEGESPGLSIEELEIGDWCLVKYDEEIYPGEVTEKTSSEVKVNVMVKSGKYWKWPNSKDEVYYTMDKVIKKLSRPEVVNSRGHFKFEGLHIQDV